MVTPKEEPRYSNERSQAERYYDERSHYFREVRDDRDVTMNTNNSSGSMSRHSQEPTEPDRGTFLYIQQSKLNFCTLA